MCIDTYSSRHTSVGRRPSSTTWNSDSVASAYTNNNSVTQRETTSDSWQYCGTTETMIRMHVTAVIDCVT